MRGGIWSSPHMLHDCSTSRSTVYYDVVAVLGTGPLSHSNKSWPFTARSWPLSFTPIPERLYPCEGHGSQPTHHPRRTPRYRTRHQSFPIHKSRRKILQKVGPSTLKSGPSATDEARRLGVPPRRFQRLHPHLRHPSRRCTTQNPAPLASARPPSAATLASPHYLKVHPSQP